MSRPNIEIDDTTAEDFARECFDIVARLKPLMAGHGPAMQGAVLADLISLWVAGHAPDSREGMMKLLFDHVTALVPESDKELFGERGHPDTWE
jgi:hypothetical protein